MQEQAHLSALALPRPLPWLPPPHSVSLWQTAGPWQVSSAAPAGTTPSWNTELVRKGVNLSPEVEFILWPNTQGHQQDPLSRRGIKKKKVFMTAGNALQAKWAWLVMEARHLIPPWHKATAAEGRQDHAPLLRIVPPPVQSHSPCPALRNGAYRWHNARLDSRTSAPTSHPVHAVADKPPSAPCAQQSSTALHKALDKQLH